MSALAITAVVGVTGCALVWQPTDTPRTKAAKLTARVPLAVVTLGISEVVISRETERERQWQAAAEKKVRRDQLTAEMERWKTEAYKAKSPSDRQLALALFQAAREDLAALDGRRASTAPPGPLSPVGTEPAASGSD